VSAGLKCMGGETREGSGEVLCDRSGDVEGEHLGGPLGR
jgi:hypothetical protein